MGIVRKDNPSLNSNLSSKKPFKSSFLSKFSNGIKRFQNTNSNLSLRNGGCSLMVERLVVVRAAQVRFLPSALALLRQGVPKGKKPMGKTKAINGRTTQKDGKNRNSKRI